MRLFLAMQNTVQTPWIHNYPAGVPAQAQIGAYRSLNELLESAFRKHAQRDALCCMDTRMSFRELDELSGAFGAWLQSLKLEPGSRVAIMMPNVPQYMVAMAGILRAGYVVVNVNPLYTARELQHQLKDSGARAIVVLENFAHTLEEVIANTDVQHVVLASIGELLGFLARSIHRLCASACAPHGAGVRASRGWWPHRAAVHRGTVCRQPARPASRRCLTR